MFRKADRELLGWIHKNVISWSSIGAMRSDVGTVIQSTQELTGYSQVTAEIVTKEQAQLERIEQSQKDFLLAENRFVNALDTLAESQGKLLAALNEHDEWAKDADGIELAKYEKRCEAWEGYMRRLEGKLDAIGAVLAEILSYGQPRKGRAKTKKGK